MSVSTLRFGPSTVTCASISGSPVFLSTTCPAIAPLSDDVVGGGCGCGSGCGCGCGSACGSGTGCGCGSGSGCGCGCGCGCACGSASAGAGWLAGVSSATPLAVVAVSASAHTPATRNVFPIPKLLLLPAAYLAIASVNTATLAPPPFMRSITSTATP